MRFSGCFPVQIYDIITAKEKQAARSGICFSAVNNEKAFDEVKQRARKRGLASLDDIKPQKKSKRRGAAFAFQRLITSKRPMKSDKERESAGLRVYMI